MLPVYVDDHAFEAQCPHGHSRARLDRSLRVGSRHRSAGPAGLRPCLETSDDAFERGAGIRTHRPGLAGVERGCCASRRLLCQFCGPGLQPLDDRVDFAAAFPQLIVELGVEATTIRVFAFANRLFARSEGAFGIHECRSLLGDGAAIRLQPSQVLVHARQVLGQLLLAVAQILARKGDHTRRHPEPCGDLDRETAARRSIHQSIGGCERLRREPERSADHALGCGCVRLQRVVVRGRDQVCSAAPEVIDDGDAKGSTFDGVGSGADLVDQHESWQCQRAVHRHDIRDVSREGAEACRNRLLVADVGEKRLEDRDARSRVDRNMQARLRHGGEKSGGLQRDGLASRIRPCNQEDSGRRGEEDVDRYRFRPSTIAQGVPSAVEGRASGFCGLRGGWFQV